MHPIRITARLWIKDTQFMDFEAFENAVFAIMAKHGAKVLDIQKNHASLGQQPHETHVLEFPNQTAFDSYRTDPKLLAMAQLRERCISKTEIVVD